MNQKTDSQSLLAASCVMRKFVKPLSTVPDMVAEASVASNEVKVELDSHPDMCVVGDNYLVIHYHNRPVYIYNYNSKEGHRSSKKVEARDRYHDQQS